MYSCASQRHIIPTESLWNQLASNSDKYCVLINLLSCLISILFNATTNQVVQGSTADISPTLVRPSGQYLHIIIIIIIIIN